MKKTITLIALIFSFNINCQELFEATLGSPYQNLREGKSDLIDSKKEEEISKLYYKEGKSIEVLRSIISDKTINRCATKIVSSIRQNLNLRDKDEVELALLGLRLDDSLDDISTKILIEAANLSIFIPNPIARNNLTNAEEERALLIYKTRSLDIKNKSLCIEDVYRGVVGKLGADSPRFLKNLKHLNKIALDNNIINANDFKTLEKLRARKVHEWPITLSEYSARLGSISKAFPLRIKETASIVTDVKFRAKKSLRQSLYERYEANQIMLLANVVKSLKTRLDSNQITIHIDYVDQASEIINLSPMEKFRFILKLLRKELSQINNSTLLGGRPAGFMDIIVASYEVGYISSNEIKSLASLQEIWNPSKSVKEKVMYWTKTFGGIAAVLLPPPFGFVSVMAIMVIDQAIAKAPVDRDSDFNLM